jgi:hypothetical protein
VADSGVSSLSPACSQGQEKRTDGADVFSHTLKALHSQTVTIVDASDSFILGSDLADVLSQDGGGP